MIRWWISSFQLAELFISSVVHLLYGFYVYSTAVAADLSQALSECVFKSNVSLEVKKQDPSKSTVDDLPPIVLVHGIFGFGKGKFGSFSYFGGAEKKDERVLVPDLGSLTSIYDRARELFYRFHRIGQHQHAAGIDGFGTGGDTQPAAIALPGPILGRAVQRRAITQQAQNTANYARLVTGFDICKRRDRANLHTFAARRAVRNQGIALLIQEIVQ